MSMYFSPILNEDLIAGANNNSLSCIEKAVAVVCRNGNWKTSDVCQVMSDRTDAYKLKKACLHFDVKISSIFRWDHKVVGAKQVVN